MKVKVSELKPNPFKKEIDGGKLNLEQVKKLKGNVKELGLMGSIPVVKINGKYHLISHHHRLQALKEVFGKNHEVEVFEHKYTEEKMFRGMIVENLTQRSGDFHQETIHLVAIKKMLDKNRNWLLRLNIFKREDSRGHDRTGSYLKSQNIGSTAIEKWLNKNGTIMNHQTIHDYLKINDELDDTLKEQMSKKHDKSDEDKEEGINYTQALLLSDFKDKEEQKELAEALKDSSEGRVREQGKLLTVYKGASEDIKQKVRDGNIDIKDVENEMIEESIKERNKDKEKIEFIPNMDARMRNFSLEVVRVQQSIAIFSKVFKSDNFQSKYRVLNKKTRTNLNSWIINIEDQINRCLSEIKYFKSQMNDKILIEVKK